MAEKEPKSSTDPLEGTSPEVGGHDEADGTIKKKSKSKKPKQDPRLIVDGLQLSLKGNKQPLVSYTYALTPLMESGTKIELKMLTTEPVESQHIRLHTLEPGDTLTSIATTYRKSYTVAVILINTEDSLELPPAVTEGVTRSKKTAFPIAVVSSEDGKSLKELLNRHETGELCAKLEAKNQIHTELRVQPLKGGSSPGSESTITLNTRKRGLSFRIRGRRVPVLNLKEEVKALIFPVSGPVCVSEDEEKFKSVMTVFYQYELTIQKGGHLGGGPLFTKLLKHIDEMFARDFPFFLLVAYRVQKKQTYYLGDEMRHFVNTCVEKFERLEPVSIAKTLETFFIKIEDFHLLFESDNSTHSIYQLLEEACITLMTFSFTQKKSQEPSLALSKAVYYRSLWISTAYKCHVQRGTGPREKVDYWKDQLTAAESFVHLDTDVIQSLKRGVEFGRLLQLPDEASFTSPYMAEVLTTKGVVRPFYQLREFVIILEPYIQPEEDFVKHMLVRPKECYQKAKKEGWRKAHGDRPLLSIIKDGVAFLDTVLEVSRKRQWSSDQLNSELKEWLSVLLEPVEVTGEGTEACLKELLSHKAGGVTKHYYETIKRELVVKLETGLSKLSVEQFLQLYKAFFIWPPWIVQKFLKQYQIPQSVKICSNTWKEFFNVFVERFPDATHHRFVLEFFQSVAKHYIDQSRAKDFILDLLRVDVPRLFVRSPDQISLSSQHSGEGATDILALPVPDEFSQFLTDYVQRNLLRDQLMDDIETIWELIADDSDFQKLILQVLQHELVPESGSLHGPLNQQMKFLLKHCVDSICKGLDSLHDLSSRLTFCWGIVSSCCQKMPLTENLDWISIYYSVIDQLGRIYSVYQSTQDAGDTRSVLTEDSLSSDVTECPTEGVVVFFKWIAQAQRILGEWKDRLKTMDVNYDELLLYLKHISQIGRAAVSLSSDGLVMDSTTVKAMKQDFLQQFELLNMFLIRYVVGQPEAGWCSLLHILSTYGVNLPDSILLAITKYVLFPGESPITARRAISLENKPTPCVSGSFRAPGEIQLEITRELALVDLRKLVQAIADFLEPVADPEFLSFFVLCESEIFDKYLKLQLRKLDSKDVPVPTPQTSLSLLSISLETEHVMQGVSIKQLARALNSTKDFICRLVVGNASYVEIVAEGSLSLRSLDIDQEFSILGEYVKVANVDAGDAKGLDGVKAMLQLFQYIRHIQVIHSVCQQYNLVNCLEDPNLKELVELVETLEKKRDNLTAKDAIDKMEKVTKILCLEPGQSLRFLDLFSAMQDSSDFHRFVVQEKQFVGVRGKELFEQQFQLIKTQLQHEEYNEAVLNHLYAAFKLIVPFTDAEQDFEQLMTSVAGMNAKDSRRQLETVNRNINLIRLWFSRAEGDTLQGVSTELRCILGTGYYTFVFSSSSAPLSQNGETGSIVLHYIPYSSLYQNVGEVGDYPSIPTETQWNEEAIGDFVRKLGFLDAEGEVEYKINHFLHINQTATKVLGLYAKLRELGHPNFLSSSMMTIVRFTLTREEADDTVSETAQLLTLWEKEVANLRNEYEQLLYFSIPKLLHLYQNLTAEQPKPTTIVQDVGFLFENKPHVQAQLRESVKDLLETKSYIKTSKKTRTPMHVVGAFLSSLFSNLALSTNSLKRRRRGSVGSNISRSSSSGQSTHILHSCVGFTRSQLLQLIISIYGGVPEAFEVYHCRPTTTEEELRMFMNPKRATKRPFQYLILEVNKLPYRLQEALVRIHFDLKQAMGSSDEMDSPCVHFVETGPSLLQEMPWLLRMDYKGTGPQLDFAEASSTSREAALHADDFKSLLLVYGHAGDGKTHYIEKQMIYCPEFQRVAVNEAFTPISTIQKLCSMEFEEPEAAVFFNFTLLPPGEAVSENERTHYNKLVESINWFFFDLFILGYVEDPVTGQSFRFPGGMRIAIYVEVPSRVRMDPEASLQAFNKDIPSLGLLGTKHYVEPSTPFMVDDDVQLVCKYLKAYKTGGTRGIDRLYKESGGLFGGRKPGIPVKFSLENDLSEAECRKLLDRYTPQHMKVNKATQKLFIKYMKRRCAFLDNCPAFNYNSGATEYLIGAKGEKKRNDTTQLGSTLMDTMLKEVSDFCDPLIRENWALKPHHQLIYDFKDGGGSIGLMSLHPDKIPKDDMEKFRKIGVEMPSMFELYSRKCLDSFLSRALDIPLTKEDRLSPVDDSQYVLTLDFALKMLNIHERAEGGVPVIIEGETGVGKTALIEMLSKLWNYSLFSTWNVYKDRIMDFIKGKLQELPPSSFKQHAGSMESMLSIAQNTTLREDDLMQIAEIPLPGNEDKQFYSIIRDHLLELAGDPLLSVLEVRPEDDDSLAVPFMVASAKYKDNPKDTTRLLFKFLNCRMKNLFFKLNVHAALQPSEIMDFFAPIFEQAKMLKRAYERFTTQVKVPFITVFLDEVNTSSCLGLFKEVIVDRTLDGEPVPSNVFIVGACNPHRGNSLAAHGSQETWIRGTYYVRQLHPTIQCLMWDYGALGEQQERDYILAKMKLSNRDTSNADIANLTELIVLSQNLMRKYAMDQLKDCGLSNAKSSEYSRSCVSQRDIQRVFSFYEWLCKMYVKYRPRGDQCDYNSRAVAVALGLVYFLRLNTAYRKKYRKVLDHEMAPSQLSFSKTFQEELDWYINHIDLPKGIAKTEALKENLFAAIVCTMTHTPLIMVGSPGSSKTLSFNLTLANLKGQESKVPQFRETEIFKSLDPQIYQCSRRTTSNEITTVFKRAINRQRSHQSIPLPVYCVVFMDEAGLPEERHESLKVLHYFLDTQEVSFVAISNHVLDAAKTNRAVSLFRPEATREELTTLAKGCLCTTPDRPPPELKRDMSIVSSFCTPYLTLMSKERFARFFGLRDFINFISYLRRKREEMLNPQLVMEALERNFNGVSREDFHYICRLFLRAVHSSPEKVIPRNILDILCSSIMDHPEDTGAENEMRYKLIIDSSDDGSLVRLLFSTGVLHRRNTRVYVCSDFPGDAELQKVNTIAAIRHSVTEGHTVVLSQTDSIHESFYDLFNRRFHRIDAASGPRYYANIAIGAHIKPCRVHKDFDCVVVVKQSEVESIPPPFLNRFEKYFLSHELVLEATLSTVPPALAAVLRAALKKAGEFVECISGSSSLYGLQAETLSSLLMSLLPPLEHDYVTTYAPPTGNTGYNEVQSTLMKMLLRALKENAGFQIPSYSEEELRSDTAEVMEIIMLDSEFSGQILRLMSMESNSEATQVIHEAVVEALHVLHFTKSVEEFRREVSANACMVVSMLTHWLVRYLCKRVMQLMTSEALCMHHRKIPSTFIQAYLNHQYHFSLKELLETQMKELDEDNSCAANKLVCFMRSSSPLHQLPAQYPMSVTHYDPAGDRTSLLKELVFTKTEELVVHKMSSITSFSNVNELLKNFTSSSTQRVLLIIVNMEDATKELVNHLRIMIEEAESKYSSQKKMFALLLHFQTCRPTSPCYPVMFLPGWDFNYLEMVGYSPRGGVLDIRDWFRQCYGTSSNPDHSIAPHLSALLHEAIPAISSRVSFRNHPDSPFNKAMKIPERNRALEKLFLHKGVGEVLCQRFNSYWTPGVMVEYLEKAAQHAQQHESPNVIDNLQTNFKSLFVDFLVFMVYEMNKGMNIDVLFDTDCTGDTVKLFLDILRIIPIPKLPEITMMRIANDASALKENKQILSPPKFPYFALVSNGIERLVDQVQRDSKQNIEGADDDLLSVLQYSEHDRVQTMSGLFKSLQTKLSEISQGDERTPLSVGLSGLLSLESHWFKYLEDFTHQKLLLEYDNYGISDKVRTAAFGDLENRTPVQRLAILHVYVHIHRLNLAKVVSILRPLDQVEDVMITLTSMAAAKATNATQSLLASVEDGSDLLGCSENLSSFVIGTLFNAIASISMAYFARGEGQLGAKEVEQVKLWFKAYKDVMSMPSMKEHFYVTRSAKTEAQHSAMQLLYLLIRSRPLTDVGALQCDLDVFSQIFNKFFTTKSELQGSAPRLEDLATAVLGGLPQSPSWDLQQARGILEGLFSHCFSEYRPVYHSGDMEWFLELANGQKKWQATYIMDGIYEFEYSEDLNTLPDESETPEELKLDSLAATLPMSVFKFYLRRIILTSIKSTEDPIRSVMLFFNKTEAHKLITKVLCSSPDGGRAGSYIPTFYQLCDYISPSPSSENKLMQQPLAHLYFLTVLEDLKDSNYGLSGLVKTVHNISKCEHLFEGQTCNCLNEQSNESSTPGCQLVLLHIEEQALTQVTLKEVARHLDPTNPTKINALFAVLSEVNAVMDDKWMGGGEIGGHGLTLAMHLLREKKSFQKFVTFLTTEFSTVCDGITCLLPLNHSLSSVAPAPPLASVKPESQSFMPYQDMGSEVMALYTRVVNGMNAVHSSHGSSAKSREKEFIRLGDECSSGELNVTTPSGAPGTMNKMACFRTTLWLATYNEFFLKKRQSKSVAQAVGNMSKRIGATFVQLIQCFLDPELMRRGTGEYRRSPLSPLQALFTHENTSMSDLQRALVHLITAILAAPPGTTNLWCLLFNSNNLLDSYIPGFMYDSPVGPNTRFYECGVELTSDGFYARLDTIQHLTRGTLGLHSLYSLLWANFSSLFVALLTQPNCVERLSGRLFSSGDSIVELCSAQMMKMWDLLCSGLSVSEEERVILVSSCLNRLIEQQLSKCSDLRGRMMSQYECDRYERNWHTRIFTPSWDALKAGFESANTFLTMPVIKDIIKLDARYPWTPGIPSLTDVVLSSINTSDPAHSLYPLSQFVIEYPRLRVGVDLLPHLLELYQWLHTELSYAVSYEQATTITLGRLSNVLTKHSMLTGVNKLKEMFNRYVQLTGCTGHLGPVALGDDTPLLHLLSCSSQQSTDLLYTVTRDVITFLNNFFERMLTVLTSSTVSESLYPSARPRVPVPEFVHHYMLIAQTKSWNDLLQLIHGHTILPIAYPTNTEPDPKTTNSYLPGQLSSLIDLPPLQEDILSLSIVGMPLIDSGSIDSLRLPFKFKEDSSLQQLKLQDYAIDLESIAGKLPESFKRPLDDTYRKRLEYEFHSAGYHTVMEVITGLRTAIGHLIKDVSDGKERSDLLSVRLPEYLIALYEYDTQDSTTDVFHEIGINSLSQAQHVCLDTLTLDSLFHTRNMFVSWAEDGLYDFCSLPFGVKKQMSIADDDKLTQLPGRFEGSPADLLKALRSLVEVLVHLEPSIVKTAVTTPQRGLVQYLEKLKVCNNIATIKTMIPANIKLENYVTLRLAMRRLMTRVQATVTQSELVTPEPLEEKWNEFIPKFWDNRLPHFRHYGYVVRPMPTSVYQPAESTEVNELFSTTILDELIRENSEKNLLEAFAEEELKLEGSILVVNPYMEEYNRFMEESITAPLAPPPMISDEELQRLAKRVSVEQVVEFLTSVQLDQYATTFEESEISGELLVQFQDEELEEMEIDSPLDRLKIIVYFKRYLMQLEGIVHEVVPPNKVAKILEEYRQLRPYAKAFLENGVDSDIILSASDKVFLELGVEKGAHRLMIRSKFVTE